MLERITFLAESSGLRISALLNPDRLNIRRHSGVRTLAGRPGTVTGTTLADDPVVLNGAGRTELDLELLFDVNLVAPVVQPGSGPPQPGGDVRNLTGPLWRLAENDPDTGGPTPFRVLWSKYLNVRVVIEAVAERLECFGADGVPQRSYVSLRMLRLADSTEPPDPGPSPALPVPSTAEQTPRPPTRTGSQGSFHVVEQHAGPQQRSVRLDQLAATYYGDPSLWRLLAASNQLDDPWPKPGQVLMVPSLSAPEADPGSTPASGATP